MIRAVLRWIPSLAPTDSSGTISGIIPDYWAQLTTSRCPIPMKEISRAHEHQTDFTPSQRPSPLGHAPFVGEACT